VDREKELDPFSKHIRNIERVQPNYDLWIMERDMAMLRE
jgi:hypothetical protein